MKRHKRSASPKPHAVHVREEWLTLPTYEPAPPDKNPMFLEKRVYQGSSGKVYPLPFTDRIAEKPMDRGSGRRSGSKTNFCACWCCRKSAGASTPFRTRPTATT